MSILDDLRGKRVLVTGGSTGIGAAVAVGFAAHGAAVAVHYNNSRSAAQKVEATIMKNGGKAITVHGDMMTSAQAEWVVEQAVAALGGLDILINNAGRLPFRAKFSEFNDANYDFVTSLNVRSMLAASKAAHPYLRANGGGAIINTGSIAARTGGRPGSGLYAAAKAQVHAISKGMASEFAPDNIRVNTVAPGFVETAFHKDTPAEALEQAKASTPLRRLGTADDLVGVYLFLGSNKMSGYITGQTIDVNGGMLMP